jgi:hypothetical protein
LLFCTFLRIKVSSITFGGFTIVTIAGILLLFGSLHFWTKFKELKSMLVNISFGINTIISGLIAGTSYYGNQYGNQGFINFSNNLLIVGIIYLTCCVAIGMCNEHIQRLYQWLKDKLRGIEYEISLEDLILEEPELEENEEENEEEII